MNFNFNSQPEYQLNTSLAEEMIRLYGVLTKFIVTEKINKDDNVFGDYSHMKSDSTRIYDIYMLPENSEDWDTDNFSLTSFGMVNFENVSLFVAKSSFDPIALPGSVTGNLIMFPNNKVMEITNADFVVPGVNNLFTYSDAKSVYKLTCKPHDFKLINELDNVDISNEPDVPYETLDVYFQELVDRSVSQDTEAEVTPQVTTVENKLLDEKKEKPIVDRTEDDVWGQYN